MWSPLPPDPGNLKYWNQEPNRRAELGRSGGLPFELIRLLWFLVKGVWWLAFLPIRLSFSWWLRRRQKKTQDPLDWLNER
jgi:hypothetical protein